MEKNSEQNENSTFINDRDTIRDFISRVRRVQYLATISGVSKSTVERTFKLDKFDHLAGNTLTVWENAVKMYDEFEGLKKKTKDVAESIRQKEMRNNL